MTVIAALLVVSACTSTTTPTQPAPTAPEHGLASWYGQEFAGRTTANGEIFDPMLMTAAHRTLPFGTLLDVKNPKTGQTVRVRINDRGPYINNRIIDLSYAAAQQIGLTEGAGGDVDLAIVKLGNGEREPPAPFVVTIPDNNKPATTAANEPPKVEMPVTAPAPAPVTTATVTQVPPPVPVTVDNVQVQEEHKGVETRRQVAPGGRSVEVVPVAPSATPAPKSTEPSTAEALDAAEHPRAAAKVTPAPKRTPPPAPAPVPHSAMGKFAVQVGAFSIEANAKALQERLSKIGQDARIDHTSLYLVRIGPFDTREQAIKARERLETAGISAIIVTLR